MAPAPPLSPPPSPVTPCSEGRRLQKPSTADLLMPALALSLTVVEPHARATAAAPDASRCFAGAPLGLLRPEQAGSHHAPAHAPNLQRLRAPCSEGRPPRAAHAARCARLSAATGRRLPVRLPAACHRGLETQKRQSAAPAGATRPGSRPDAPQEVVHLARAADPPDHPYAAGGPPPAGCRGECCRLFLDRRD